MSTRRQIVSDIRGMNKLLSTDILLSDRLIDREAFSAALVFIKQQIDRRRLMQSPNIYTPLSCLKMEKAPLGECCEYTSSYSISRSVEKIPKIAEGIFGLLVNNCVSVDNLISFREGTPRRFANALNLGIKADINMFWVMNDRVYCSNGDLEAINFSAFFEGDVPNYLLCPTDCDCKPHGDCDPCLNPLDQTFRCPGYLEESVKQAVAKKLVSEFFNIPTDKTSDNKDDESK